MYLAIPFVDAIFVNADVNVVLPWSTCPIVPTFACGFLRSNFAFAMALPPLIPRGMPGRELRRARDANDPASLPHSASDSLCPLSADGFGGDLLGDRRRRRLVVC